MRKRNPRHGSALIEAAFVLPVFALLACGSVDFVRTLYLSQITASAARAGAHRALRCDPHALDLDAIERAAIADAALKDFSATATRVCACTAGDTASSCDRLRCTAAPIAYVRVETRAEWKPLLRYPGLESAKTVHGEAIVRVE